MPHLDNQLTNRIKETVLSVVSDAEIFIYGSRVRGDAADDSDWDVMVITDRTVTDKLKKSIRHALYEIEWEHGCVISSIIHSREEWTSPRMRMTPFYQNVSGEAVRI